mmetsp:Transcript_6025/g.13634  ORF Transcript_6025/g.13634 Transcript_6025/m.13634 type:complete len:303 (-) Transcript_6025:1-909(-)
MRPGDVFAANRPEEPLGASTSTSSSTISVSGTSFRGCTGRAGPCGANGAGAGRAAPDGAAAAAPRLSASGGLGPGGAAGGGRSAALGRCGAAASPWREDSPSALWRESAREAGRSAREVGRSAREEGRFGIPSRGGAEGAGGAAPPVSSIKLSSQASWSSGAAGPRGGLVSAPRASLGSRCGFRSRSGPPSSFPARAPPASARRSRDSRWAPPAALSSRCSLRSPRPCSGRRSLCSRPGSRCSRPGSRCSRPGSRRSRPGSRCSRPGSLDFDFFSRGAWDDMSPPSPAQQSDAHGRTPHKVA